jgi:release factor glutamine methyltransferase
MLTASMSRATARKALAVRLSTCGVEAAEREAELVISAAAGLRRIDLIADPEQKLGEAAERIELFARRREAGEPLSRIVGRREFWSLTFALSPDVLDPRPDSETIVAAALEELAERRGERLKILDFGVGSGAILAALVSELPAASGLGVDCSAAAADMARQNVAALGLFARADIRVGDWGEGLDGRFDLIVSNPPYIPTDEIGNLAREVSKHDPKLALDGGRDGLDAYRRLGPDMARLIEPREGLFFVEHGEGQGDAVRAILSESGLETTFAHEDLNGVERVVGGRLRR